MRIPIATLTTDFGANGPYVAAVKGVILTAVPNARLIDVSHQIAPQNIPEAAFVLSSITEVFPPETVHLGVVDPGVGTTRRLIAARVAHQWYVVPDNGILSYVVRDHQVEQVFEIDNPAIARPEVSNTFHGRDVLAPAAAHLLLGHSPEVLGPPRHGVETLPAVAPRYDEHGVLGEIIFRDYFGNLVTNVPATLLDGVPHQAWEVEIAGQLINGLSRTYGLHPPNTLVALIGGTGWLEIAVVNGNAARRLNAGPGATVWLRRRH